METSKQQDERIQRQADLLAKELKKATNRTYWFGIIIGFLIGLGVGAAIAYHTIDRVVIVPLGPGVKV